MTHTQNTENDPVVVSMVDTNEFECKVCSTSYDFTDEFEMFEPLDFEYVCDVCNTHYEIVVDKVSR